MADKTNELALMSRWGSLATHQIWGDDAPYVGHGLLARYGELGRAYHNRDHLLECLVELDAVEDAADDWGALATALWFHDAVYDPTRSDNEAASADLAARQLAALGAEPDEIARVRQLVLDTAHKVDPATPDGRLVVDIDLSILGKDPARFDHYDRAIRAEYAHVPEPAYRAGRTAVLRSFLDRSAIYRTEQFAARYDQPARENLRRAIDRLASA